MGDRPMDWKLEVVVVPVSDVDRGKRFYSEQVGFVVDTDFHPTEQFRVVQLTPPGSACSITLMSSSPGGMAPGAIKGLQLVVTDIGAARARLVAGGVEVSEIVHFEDGVQAPGPGGDYNSFIFFSDPDGNGWSVQQISKRA
jgi:catechol 2,3-dioxygenase-like lactoylglutathione lyase family enzyme